MSGAVLITGATGFVGMEVLARLLDRDDHTTVIALVRADDDAGAAARLAAVLERVDATGHAGRCRAVRGDVESDGLGLSAADRELVLTGTRAIVHCAATVSFALGVEAARAVNVEGTRRVLDLAEEIPELERMVHVSTAYVAGTHAGRFGEDDTDVGQGFRNGYEQSKLEAELLVRSRTGLPVSVVRPSIIVGDSRTGWTSAFNVLYFPLQAYARKLETAIPADPDALVDVVPIDYVADGILAALDAEAPCTLALVAGERAPRMRDVVELAGRYFDRPPPRLVPPDRFEGSSAMLEALLIYFPYFEVLARFDDEHAGELGLSAPALDTYFDGLMAYAEATRWGKRQPPRPRAHALPAP